MNWSAWLLWGFVSTIVLTIVMAGSQGVGLTRMSLPYMLGTLFTPNRDRAKVAGIVLHLIDGWIFSLMYIWAFHSWGAASWWRGGVIGLVHVAFVLTAGMAFVTGLHPRMASEQQGPTVVRQLEPPGFLALNYGYATPVAMVIGHLLYGIILGAFYPLAR